MIESILKQAGIPAKQGRFPDPPSRPYAVWFDSVVADGADRMNLIYTHAATVELYEPKRDNATEETIEAVLNGMGIPWEKQDRMWLDAVKRYQVIYEFEYIEKRRI
jgi:hypothetical protein